MKDFTNYERSQELRELGFDEPCFGIYNIDMDILPIIDEPYTTTSKYGAILLSQAFRFFREKYGLFSSFVEYSEEETFEGYYMYHITGGYNEDGFIRYEEAESACLDKLIEIAKNR